jgi:hypothetical protein
MSKINANSVSLAGEFAVLAQLALRGFDANMTLGRTKSVDILVSNPSNGQMYQLEVKTNYKNNVDRLRKSRIHGCFLSDWIMSKKHETIMSPNLFYAFVNISKDDNTFRYYVVPSSVVAKYVKEQHICWLKADHKKAIKEGDMRIFRIGRRGEQCPISIPTEEQYKDNWKFNSTTSETGS